MQAFGLMGLTAALFLAADTAPLNLSGDFTIPATVAGMPARLHLDPGAPSMPVLHPDFAARADVKAGWIATRAAVGPVRVPGKSAVVRLDIGSGEYKRRATWFEAPYFAQADAAIGPGGVPADRVRFDIRPEQPGEATTSLPLTDFLWVGMGVVTQLDGDKMIVRFSLDRAYSLATAGAGAALAETHDGRFDRPPEKSVVHLGVERPIRHLALATPYQIGPFSLTGLMVRTGDFGSTAGVKDKDTPEADPDEIVVTARKKQKRRLRLEIGRDQLNRCSSILFDKKAKTISFTCLPA